MKVKLTPAQRRAILEVIEQAERHDYRHPADFILSGTQRRVIEALSDKGLVDGYTSRAYWAAQVNEAGYRAVGKVKP